jgi:hypothetical protein
MMTVTVLITAAMTKEDEVTKDPKNIAKRVVSMTAKSIHGDMILTVMIVMMTIGRNLRSIKSGKKRRERREHQMMGVAAVIATG